MFENSSKAQISRALFDVTTIAQDSFGRVLNGRITITHGIFLEPFPIMLDLSKN